MTVLQKPAFRKFQELDRKPRLNLRIKRNHKLPRPDYNHNGDLIILPPRPVKIALLVAQYENELGRDTEQ
jgi:hypothetical protein